MIAELDWLNKLSPAAACSPQPRRSLRRPHRPGRIRQRHGRGRQPTSTPAHASPVSHMADEHAAMGHAAMIGDGAPAVGGPHDLDALLYPPPALPYEPGRVREYTLTAIDREIEIAPGVFFPAWTYNGTVPGPVIRATEGDMLRVKLRQRRLASAHDPLPRHPPDEHGRRLRGRPAGRRVHLRVRGAAGRPCTSTTATRRR